MKYRKKPIVVEAVQWTGSNLDELRAFVPEEFRYNKIHQPMGIWTLEGVMTISEGDWIIKGVKGEFYPCKPDIFAESYENVIDEADISMSDAPLEIDTSIIIEVTCHRCECKFSRHPIKGICFPAYVCSKCIEDKD